MSGKANLLSVFGRREVTPREKADSLRRDAEAAIEKSAQAEARLRAAQEKLEVAQAEAFALADAKQDARAKGTIRQGVKAKVDTVPMPVRLEVSQVKKLKILAAMSGTTASAIIRECIQEHLDARTREDAGFANAVLMALGPDEQ